MYSRQPITEQPVSFHPPPITTAAAAVSSSFLLPPWVSSSGFMIPLQAVFNLIECDLGKMLHCKPNQWALKSFWNKLWCYYLMCSRPFRHIQNDLKCVSQVKIPEPVLYIKKLPACFSVTVRQGKWSCLLLNISKCFYVKRQADFIWLKELSSLWFYSNILTSSRKTLEQ